ncbi:MAG: DUF1015 family protein [Ignavibacteriaceae bacterium]
MALVKPFKALRPAKEVANLVASVPYDVVNTQEAKELADNNPLSFLRVTRAEIELPESTDVYSHEVYKKANENLLKLQKEGKLQSDSEDHYYLYKLEMNGHTQVGIAAAFSIDDYDNNVILKHEKTRKIKEDDRTNHIVTTNAQTGTVFLTYKSVPAINNIVNKTLQESVPVYDFTADDGIKHAVWIVPAEFNNILQEEFAKVKNLYIADGHHRAASAGRARKVKKDSNPGHNGTEDYNFFLAVIFPADQVKILPYNRIIYNLNGLTEDEFLKEISEKFNIEKSKQKEPGGKKTFGMYLNGEWYLLKIKDSVNASLSLSDSISGTLDVSILQDFLFNPVLGIDDQRTNQNIDFIGGIRGTNELEKLVNNGDASAAFTFYPVSVEELMKISDAGEIMPPKSTWFEPKLRDGLLVYLI